MEKVGIIAFGIVGMSAAWLFASTEIILSLNVFI
jgi:hypothetical protein